MTSIENEFYNGKRNSRGSIIITNCRGIFNSDVLPVLDTNECLRKAYRWLLKSHFYLIGASIHIVFSGTTERTLHSLVNIHFFFMIYMLITFLLTTIYGYVQMMINSAVLIICLDLILNLVLVIWDPSLPVAEIILMEYRSVNLSSEHVSQSPSRNGQHTISW